MLLKVKTLFIKQHDLLFLVKSIPPTHYL